MKLFPRKILALLRIKPYPAGLEITDEVIRLARFDGKGWQLHAVRLLPGALVRGVIKNPDAVSQALNELKIKALGRDSGRIVSVVACFSSVPDHTQVLSIPMSPGASFDEAVDLNLKMASPLPLDETYYGWQIVGRNESTFEEEVLSMFMENKPVNGLVEALFSAGFLPTAVESQAAALARIFRASAALPVAKESYIFMNIDNAGIEFLIIRNGFLYFEYAEPWGNIADDKGEIVMEKFRDVIAAATRQVYNFYRQHWSEPLKSIVISAVAFEDEAEAAVKNAVYVPVMRFSPRMGAAEIPPEWLAALGSGVRMDLRKSHDVNLLGNESLDLLRGEEVLEFLSFWRVVLPVVLAVMVLMFAGANIFLSNTKAALESRTNLNLSAAQQEEITSLETQADTFNGLVTLVSSAEAKVVPKEPFFEGFLAIASSSNITVNSLSLSSFDEPLSFSGSASSQNDIVAFKGALQSNPAFSAVSLPLASIKDTGSSVQFSMSFKYDPSLASRTTTAAQ